MGTKDEIIIHGVTIWNFEKRKDYYIQDLELQKHLEKILSAYCSEDRPIADIGIINIEGNSFIDFSEDQKNLIENIRAILFLSSILKNNIGWETDDNKGLRMRTSENFEYSVFKNLSKNDKDFGISTGRIINITHYGFKIGEKKINKGDYINDAQIYPLELDGEFIYHINKLEKVSKEIYNRIIRATQVFFQSYYNNPNLSDNAAILLQVMAFEILLNLPPTSPRKAFKEKVSKYLDLPDEFKQEYKYKVMDKPVLEKNRVSKKSIWADKLYYLRDNIVHGHPINDTDYIFEDWISYFELNTTFFCVLIKKIINEKTKVFFDEIIYDTQLKRFVYRNYAMKQFLAKARHK